MRNLLALVGLLVIGFAGLGWYLGWYKLSFSRNTEGNIQITTDVDTKKVGNDSSDFIKNAATVVGSHVDKAAQDVKTSAPTGAPGSTPGPQNLPSLPSVPVAPVVPEMPQRISVPVAPIPPAPGPITLFPPK